MGLLTGAMLDGLTGGTVPYRPLGRGKVPHPHPVAHRSPRSFNGRPALTGREAFVSAREQYPSALGRTASR
jgi:hypothetical protein